MRIMFLGIFAAVAAIYLASLFFRQGVFQAIAKACLVPLVLVVYVSGANSVFFPVVLALVFGWLGDILLVKIEDIRFFRLGLAGFLLGHICYIPSMLHFAGRLNIPILGISLLVAAALGILVRKIIRPGREMNIPSIAYETVILLMAASALQLFIARGAPFGALVFTGSLCFLVSDSMLAFFTFRAKPKYGDFPVMLTYIAAQFCIVLGFSGL